MTGDRRDPPKLDLLCLGEAMVELNQTEPGRPGFLMGHGGDTSNCAVAAARQGARVGYLSRLGGDPFGAELRRLWKSEGVDDTTVATDPDAPTGIYFVTHGPGGHEFSYYRAGSAASRMRPSDVPDDSVRDSAILHASGISQAISGSACDAVFHAMAVAREAGRQVAYDTNLRLRLWPITRARAVIHEAVRMADILLPGLDDARQLTGLDDPDAIVDHYLAMGPKVVALTLGAEGSLIATPERRERLAVHEVAAVDATGAGDAFDGAFLAELARNADPFAAGRWANASAALATLGFGAVAPLPTRAAVAEFLSMKGDRR